MTGFERESIALAILLPADRSHAWQENLAKRLSAMPGVRVDIHRVEAVRVSDSIWFRWMRSSALFDWVSVPSVGMDAPGAASHWDAVLDLAGAKNPEIWRGRSRYGVWQPMDAQGEHLAGAFPSQRSICSGAGGELFLVRDGRAVLNGIRFFANPCYSGSYGQLYEYAEVLIGKMLRIETFDDIGNAVTDRFLPLPWTSAGSRTLNRWAGVVCALRRKVRAQWFSQGWMVGVIDKPVHALLDAKRMPGVKWIGRRKNAYYRADPFGAPNGRRIYCEVIENSSGVGHIEAIDLDADDRIVRTIPVRLATTGHVSYPYLFEHDGHLYGIPETARRRCTELYEIDEDGEWRYLSTLLEGVAAADVSLFFWDGLFWLAYTDLAFGAYNNLCLRYASDLRGPWQPHLQNPVKMDHRSSRPAGTPFIHEGVLYRPGQDCRSDYGQALVINKVVRCTPQRYQEEVVRTCLPDAKGHNPHGLHTLSSWGERTLIDGYRYVVNHRELLRKFRARFSRVQAWVRKADGRNLLRGADR